MGRAFGNLPAKYKNITTYGLSPYEQRAFAGAVSKGIPNLFRRSLGTLPYLPLFFGGYYLYQWGEHQFHLTKLKNPDDYKNDE